MDWLIVVLLLLFGLLLIIAEVVIIPGTAVTGISGGILLIAGVVVGFYYLGWQNGWVILGITTLSLPIIFYFLFKADTWKRIALDSTSSSRLTKPKLEKLEVGLKGITVSSLRPSGKAEIEDEVYEVKTFGEFIHSGVTVQIAQILPQQIIVKLI